MSALLDQKYEKLFSLLDANGNDVVTHHDFEDMTNQMLAAFGEPRTSAKGMKFAEAMANYWNSLREVADVNFDGQVTKDEFRAAVGQVSNDFGTLVEPLYRAAFHLADTDDDGVVSKDEFIKAEVAVGVSADDAGATFDRLTGEDGKLTVDTLVTAVGQFYGDEAGTDSGTHLFFGSL